MPHYNPLIGYAWKKFHPVSKLEFINIAVNKAELMKIPEDDYGNINLTVTELKNPKPESKATHIVYEDDYKPKSRKNESNITSNTTTRK